MRVALLLSIPLSLPVASSLSAQSFVVSPTAYELHEGSGNNLIPFYTGQARYQQIHGDLKNMVRSISGIGFRRDGTSASSTSNGPRTFDLELLAGDADFATFTTTFATNFVNPPTNVFLRKPVNAPDHGPQPDVLPAPWDFNMVFDVPFVYTGTKDLLWELVLYSLNGSYALDAAQGNATKMLGGFQTTGTGCTTSNGTMKLRSAFETSSTANTLSMAWSILAGPSNAISTILVGITNPNVPVLGLCERLYTDALVLQLTGTTSASGTLTTTPLVVAFNPAYVVLKLTSQAASLDPSQPGLGLSASNGNEVLVPPAPTNFPVTRLFAYGAGSATAATGSRETYSYGLVTRFRY